MAERPKLRAIAGGRRTVDYDALDRELAAIGRLLSRLGDTVRVDARNEDAFTALLSAGAEVQMARVHLAHGKRGA